MPIIRKRRSARSRSSCLILSASGTNPTIAPGLFYSRNPGRSTVVKTLFALPLSTVAISTSRVNGVDPDPSSVPQASSTLTYDDLKKFTNTVSTTYLQPAANATPPSGAATANDPFGIYFRNYFEGSFYDRYGVNIAKPSFSATIGDTEINGALTMLIEYLLDSVDKTTPVFGDTSSFSLPNNLTSSSPTPNGDMVPAPAGNVTFYPGGVKYQPTAYAAGLAQYSYAPATAPDNTPCGITIGKVKFMGYMANAAGASGDLTSGLTFGSFGGLGFSLFGLIKFSLGDNQTLSGAAKTLATRLAMRAAYDAMYPIVLHVRNVPKITISNGVITASGN